MYKHDGMKLKERINIAQVSRGRMPLILDGDPGHDDAMAWMLAASADIFDIKAVTTVAGNKDLENINRNALRICTLFGIDAPIASGAAKPMYGRAITGGDFHGVSGLDGADLPEADRELSEMPAVELMAKVLRESRQPVTIVSTGALTNTGILLEAYPELKPKIRQISIMGGGIRNGNWTPAAEFNILVDPEAADIVFRSGIPIWVSPLDVTEKALIYPADRERFRSAGSRLAEIIGGWLDFFGSRHEGMGWEGSPMHDPNAVMCLYKPEIYTVKDVYIRIECSGEYTRGAMIADFEDSAHYNARVLMDLDREKFVEELLAAEERYRR